MKKKTTSRKYRSTTSCSLRLQRTYFILDMNLYVFLYESTISKSHARKGETINSRKYVIMVHKFLLVEVEQACHSLLFTKLYSELFLYHSKLIKRFFSKARKVRKSPFLIPSAAENGVKLSHLVLRKGRDFVNSYDAYNTCNW